MKFNKMDTTNKKPKHDPRYPQPQDIRMVRVTATFPMLKSNDTQNIIDEFNSFGYDLEPPRVVVEESDVTLSDLKDWMKATGVDEWTLYDDDKEYDLSTVISSIQKNSKRSKK